jgi:DUF4097 and DUF4098 domain-containing protein YvlB
MEWSFVATGPVQAHVDLPAGEVNVNSDGDNRIEVSLEPVRGGNRKALELIESSRVAFDQGRLDVHVPSQKFRSVDLVCTVTLPEGSDLAVKTASADVTCSGRLGNFSAAVASGDISLGTVEGDVSVTSASGDFQCSEIGSGLKVKTASGDVVVGRLGGAADLSLASGDVRLEDAASSVKANTASGDVYLGRAHEGEIRVRSASGDVTILVAPGTGAYLDVTSVTGDMSCTLPFDEQSSSEAKLSIYCQSVSGDVAIGSAPA